MKIAGWILILIAAAFIFYNVVVVEGYNDQQINDHPIATLFSGGSNLKGGYSFAPPYSGFEIFIIAMGIGGIVLVAIGSQKKS
jgi:hypothetical protein